MSHAHVALNESEVNYIVIYFLLFRCTETIKANKEKSIEDTSTIDM